MEHRHGHRRKVVVRVTIRTRAGAGGAGCIDEASASGARLVTTLPLRIHSIIVLSLAITEARHIRHLKLEAEVVRRTENGFGVEWTQFSPECLPALYHPVAPKAMSTASTVGTVHGRGRRA
jgi:hypothetical protein